MLSYNFKSHNDNIKLDKLQLDIPKAATSCESYEIGNKALFILKN